MNDRPFYCAACAHHGTNEHDPGCPNDDNPIEALRAENARLLALLTEAQRCVGHCVAGDTLRYQGDTLNDNAERHAKLAADIAAVLDGKEKA